MKPKLLISFSGGRTSAYMLWWILNNWREKYDMIVVFANTGKEHEETFKFVEKCAEYFKCEVVWVEPVSNSVKGWAVAHKVVDYNSAARNGEPFEEFIKKIGIPNTNNPWCSSMLKKLAIIHYLRSIGWKKFYTAIGIRYDEVDRINPNYIKDKILYPLISEEPTTKLMITKFWNEMPFDLTVPFGLGNCDNCWKKSLKSLLYNVNTYPESFNWWDEMVKKHGYTIHRKGQLNMKPPFNFFRGNLSVEDLFKLSKLSKLQLSLFTENEKLDGCSESCEPF